MRGTSTAETPSETLDTTETARQLRESAEGSDAGFASDHGEEFQVLIGDLPRSSDIFPVVH